MPNQPPKPRARSLAEQAQFIRLLCERTWGRAPDYKPADKTWLRLTADDVEALESLADGLELLAQHDDAIKAAIMAARRKKR